MMAFTDSFENLLSPNLSDEQKDKLANALNQFKIDRETLNQVDFKNGDKIKDKDKDWSPKLYTDFYLPIEYNFFLQGDILDEIRYSSWNKSKRGYEKEYGKAILLSNSCDVSPENIHGINIKQALFAPVREYTGYIEYLKEHKLSDDQIKSFEYGIKSQMFSNLFYLPKNDNDKKEYIVWLDKIFWFPIDELNKYVEDIEQNRICSLDLFGHYLFIIKLSYHLSRLPESPDRRVEYFKAG